MKKILTLIGVIAVVVLVIAVMKNPLAKGAVQSGVKMMTGLDLKMEKLDVGVLNSYVDIKNLKLNNPAGFPDPVMVELPEIFVDYNLGAFLQKKAHLEEVRLDLNEFYIITDKEGNLNLDALKFGETKEGEAPAEPDQQAQKDAMPLQIDRLKIKVGTVYIKDYSKGDQPKVQTVKINIDEEYQNIDSQGKLVRLVLWTVLKNKAIPSIPGVQDLMSNQLANVQSLVSGSLGVATKLGSEAGKTLNQTTGALTDTASGAAKGAADLGKETVGSATEALGDAANELKKLNPFGGDN